MDLISSQLVVSLAQDASVIVFLASWVPAPAPFQFSKSHPAPASLALALALVDVDVDVVVIVIVIVIGASACDSGASLRNTLSNQTLKRSDILGLFSGGTLAQIWL